MPEENLQSIIDELADAEAKLKARIESQLGKIETTDWADEYAELQDVLAKLKSLKVTEDAKV